jgi:hypothetical protein
MSEIRSMNKEIRARTALGGAVLAVIAALAIAPDAAIDLVVHNDVSPKLWWGALTGVFALAALLLEGLELGRQPRFRRELDDHICRSVIDMACDDPDCALVLNLNDSARSVARAIFYARIDQPSREVAFYQWAWLYTARIWMHLAIAALVLAFVLSWFVETHAEGLRWSAMALLAVSALLSYGIRKIWEKKARGHAESQLLQIAPNVGNRLDGAECPNQNCPATT